MEWYYAVDGKQAGPVSEAEFHGLAQTGLIRPDTLVWREGMADWLPYSTVAGGPEATALVEPAEADWEFAGFWIRFCGAFLDGLILGAIQMLLRGVFAAAGLASGFTEDPAPEHLNGELLLSLINFVVGLGYAVYFLGSKYQATPGMMICKIRIIVADGTHCSHIRALGRYFAAFLSVITFGIGYLMCAWDSEKRTLHDMICNTRVIKK